MGLASSAALAPLRRRDYSLLWAGSLVSNVGTWMQTVAVGALVTADTGRYTWTAVIAAGAFLPIGILSPIGGALADRLERRRWIAIGNLIETALAALLASLVYAGRSGPIALTLVVFAQGCVSALLFPFQTAILPDLVPRQELLAAASLNSAQFNMGRVVGPLLAGLTVAAFGYGMAFVANALSFLAVVVAVAFIRIPPPPESRAVGLFQTIREGAAAARREPGCKAAIGLIAIVALLASPFIALVPAVAHLLTNGSKSAVATATAVLTTAQGIGAVAGALAVAPLALRFGRGRVLITQLYLVCAALVVYALSPDLIVAALALTLVGSIYIGILSGLQTVVQLQAPERYRGRILSLYLVALGVLYPVGSLIQGPLADVVGLRRTTTIAPLILFTLLVGLAAKRRRVFASLGGDGALVVPTPAGTVDPAP